MKASTDTWQKTFVTELRTRGLPGSRIGELVAEVEAHCRDSGESPEHAFGQPAAYAAIAAQDLRPPAWRTALVSLSASVALMAATAGALGLSSGVATVTAGMAAVVALVPALGLSLAHTGTQGRHEGLARALPQSAVLAMMLCLLLWRTPVLHVQAVPLLIAGSVSFPLAWWLIMRANRIRKPLTGAQPVPVRLRLLQWAPVTVLATTVAVAVAFPIR